MGFHEQPNDFTCGPFALKHALLVLGRVVSGEEIAKRAGTHWWAGTDEIGLARAGHAFGCDIFLERLRNPERARKVLQSYLQRRIPVLLCVDDWEHWIAVLHVERAGFVVADSDMDPVLNVLTWPQLHRRWRYFDRDYDEVEPPVLYEMYPVQPKFRVAIRANLSVARVRFLRRPENRNLASHWDVYLEDLLSICRPPSARSIRTLSMAEFLRRHQDMILSRVAYWHGDVDDKDLAKLLRRFRFVAETYGLVIPEDATKQALADIVILVTMWAAASRGLGDMYGTGER